eukprot:6582435-Heterocapsa_arctica.AAC.1
MVRRRRWCGFRPAHGWVLPVDLHQLLNSRGRHRLGPPPLSAGPVPRGFILNSAVACRPRHLHVPPRSCVPCAAAA